MSHSITTISDLNSRENIEPLLLKFSEALSKRLKKIQKSTSCITIMIKNQNHQTKSRQTSTGHGIFTSKEIYEKAKESLKKFPDYNGIRAVGLQVSSFVGRKQYEMDLFKDVETNNILDECIANIKKSLDTKLLSVQ